MSLTQIQKILTRIDEAVIGFTKSLPASQQKIYANLVKLVKELEIDSLGSIKNNLKNIQLLTKINKEVNDIVQSEEYSKGVADFTSVYEDLATLQDGYLSEVFDKFKPTKVLREITKASINITVDQLTENGVTNLLAGELKEILKTNITSGGSYADLTEQLKTAIIGNDEVDGGLVRYARTIATDAVNQYNAVYTQQATLDFGAEWFRYTGSLMTTSRPFCEHLKDKDGGYFHIDEIPGFLQGVIGEEEIPLSKSTGLPAGMNENTTVENFLILRGGYNCGHQVFPVSEASVPDSLRSRFK